MPTTIAALVAAHPLFAGLPGDTAELVAGCSHNVAFDAGELLFAEGSAANTLYLLRRGRVELEVSAPGAGTLVVATLEANDVVGWSWLFPPYRWHFDARALQPVGAIAVDGACLRGKADADPAFGYELVKRLTAVILDRLQSTRLALLDVYSKGETT